MESIRLVNLIMNKVIIISEKSIYNNLLFINKYILICDDLDYLGDYLTNIINNYDYLYDKIYGNFNPTEYYDYIKMNSDEIFK